MIALAGIDHVCLRVTDIEAASARWAAQFGFEVRERGVRRVLLGCAGGPLAIELIAGSPAGLDHVAYRLADGCSVHQAAEHLRALGAFTSDDGHGGLLTEDGTGTAIQLLAAPARDQPPAMR